MLNNPLSYTDPSGYLFKRLNKAFGSFAPFVGMALWQSREEAEGQLLEDLVIPANMLAYAHSLPTFELAKGQIQNPPG